MRAEYPHPLQRTALLSWTARIGANTADALAVAEGSTVASARARLAAAEHRGLLSRSQPLSGKPALYTITRAGLRACGLRGLEPARVGAANAAHAIACAAAAAALARRYPDQRVMGEPELRLLERERAAPLISARVGTGPAGQALVHRPDLVLWPLSAGTRGPVAVEVELTVKAPRRLARICVAWARCRGVAGVLYLAAPDVEPPLQRAISRAQAHGRIVVAPLAALLMTAA